MRAVGGTVAVLMVRDDGNGVDYELVVVLQGADDQLMGLSGGQGRDFF